MRMAIGASFLKHVFFGLLRGNNDINVLDRSPLVLNMLKGYVTSLSFIINVTTYVLRYYLLTNGIYPKWACFVQTIHEP